MKNTCKFILKLCVGAAHGDVMDPLTACPLPCAGVRHTVKVSICRVLETGTHQTLGFAVCWPYCTQQNKNKQHEALNYLMNRNIMDKHL